MKRLSVIIAIYNVEKYLRKCLESLSLQTYDDVEFICVNDGSTDQSQDVIAEFVKRDHRFISLIKENGGLSDARNFGLENSDSEYVMFVDGDDFVDPKMCEAAVFYMDSFKLDMLVFGYRQYYLKSGRSEDIRLLIPNGVYELKKNPEILAYMPNCAWNKIYKRCLFADIRYPKGLLNEDLATTFRLLYQAKKVGFEDRALYNYLIDREGNITSTINEKIYDVIKACEILIAYYIDHEAFKEYYDELNYVVERNCLTALRKVMSVKDKKFVNDFIDAVFRFKGQYFKRRNKKYKIAIDKGDSIYLHKGLLKAYYAYKVRG